MDNNADLASIPTASRARATRIRGTERRVATVLFADIVNSSAIFARHELEEASQRLQQLIDVLSACVRIYNGTVAQEMGDGIMCLFGAPLVEEQHALRACLAARDMVRAAQDNGLSDRDDLEIRVGIASGEVLMRPVEDGLRRDFRILGEAVHRAAKLQQQADPDTVLIADSTYGLIKTEIVCESLPGVADARRLVSVAHSGQSALNLMSAPAAGRLFGRSGEIQRLLQLARSTTLEQGCGALITGDPGIGKSRLVSELIHNPELADWSVINWPQTAIRPVGARQPLEELADHLAQSAGHHSAVCDAVEVAAGTLARAAMEECYGVPVGDARWSGLDPAQRRPFLFEGLVAAIGELSRSRPLLLAVEDAHWAGTDTLRLLRDLSVNLEDGHVLLLVTSRSDAADPINPLPENSTTIALQRLGADDVLRYLDHWLGSAPELAKVKHHMLRQCEGVPLYLEESLRSLETDGIIAGDAGDYRLIDAERPIRLANSIRGLIESRIGKLSEPERRTLQQAAAIGPQFHLPILYHLFPGQREVVRTALDRLVAGGFLKAATDVDQDNQEFRHGLFQEVSYAMLPHDQRRLLHNRILSVLRRKISPSLPGRLGLMALHAGRAEEWNAAYAYSRAAGRKAERNCHHSAAEEFYSASLDALRRLPQSRRNVQRHIDLLVSLPLVLLPLGEQGATDFLEQACALAAGINDVSRHASAASLLGSYHWVYGNIDEAISLATGALSETTQSGLTSAAVSVRIRLGGMLADKGQYDQAASHLKQALQLCTDIVGDRRHGKTLYADVAAAAYISPAIAELEGPAAGKAYALNALKWSSEGTHLFSQVVARLFLGRACLLTGEADEAAHHLRQSLSVAESIRCMVFAPLTMAALGLALVQQGDSSAGLGMIEASKQYAERKKMRQQVARILVWNSRAEFLLGRYQETLAIAELARARATIDHHPGDEVEAIMLQASALAALGLRDQAREAAVKCISLGKTLGANHTINAADAIIR